VCDLNGISNDPSSEINSRHTWKINYFGRLKFAEMAKKSGVSRYIFNSTCSVYGFNRKKVFENSKKNPISTYAKANYKAERKIFCLKNRNFKVNALRNSTLYGFSNTMRLDLVINIFVLNLINKKNIFIDGDGSQYRPFISLKDICKIYNILIKNNLLPSFICNLVSFNSKISFIAEKICKTLNYNLNLIQYKKNFSDKRNYIVGSKNFKKYFGAKFKFSKFEKEIINLKKNLKRFKINFNINTIRMKFYKKKLS
jgi:nucleoside-diphosphate-sugar epimerase